MTEAPDRNASSTDSQGYDRVYAHMLAELESDPNLCDLRTELPDLSRALWTWATEQPRDERHFRIRRAGAGHVLEVSGPDRPFLVDSLLGACSALGVQADALFHPILDPPDAPLHSLIQIHLPHLTEPETQMLCDEVGLTLRDVGLATNDFDALQTKMADGITRLSRCSTIPNEYRDEAVAFLKWLAEDHFVFLGAREYRFKTNAAGEILPTEPDFVEGSNLGLLRDLDRNVLRPGSEPLFLTKEMSAFLAEPEPLVLAKATLVSRVHRRVPADYVGIKHFDDKGRLTGETRFLGLYTSEAYHESICNIPLLRQRRDDVLKLTHSIQGSHNEKAITNILESWPRDELFQTRADTLAPIIRGAANLIGRPRVRMFVRPDQFARFVSIIVFVPREAYDTSLRQRLSAELEKAYGGDLADFEPEFVGTDLVRILFEITLPQEPLQPDIALLEARLVELSRTWQTRFRSAMTALKPDGRAHTHASFFVTGFNAAYREAFEPETAVADIDVLTALRKDRPIAVQAYREPEDPPSFIRAKIYSRSGAIALSECVPIFERMGLFVAFEAGYPISPARKPHPDSPDVFWVHALYLRRSDEAEIVLKEVQSGFEDAFIAVWRGDAENDGFNGLIFNAGLSWREAALLRALCAYRHQTGMDPGRMTQIEALNRHPELAKTLTDLFAARFDPEPDLSLSDRRRGLKRHWRRVEHGLLGVTSLNHDRVLRRLAHLIMAIQRTNFYQRDPEGLPLPYLSFKIASSELEDLPRPKPFREIFITCPEVEGVHCRFGPIARGGLRWSDRLDDYRTEVLGLVKAQQVKNSVIVPVGAKGGFFAKQVPEKAQAEARYEAGVSAYKTFIQGLLGLTDNLREGEVCHPSATVIWDEHDPYLVVAADKGTARFSDIANGISTQLGFWLGDAFASGGSAGYDHKAMGITARGAWEAVKRHFREMGTDIQTEPFTVIGIGDMSGDVFGNGMLLSHQTRLLAAFNHRHIFIDPDPQDAEACWRERKRLFDLRGSGWNDYDQTLLSEGGRIFDRSAKEVILSPEIKHLTGLQTDTLTPDELIHALLKTRCDLLWFGGIGTYIKAPQESHADADDRSNDPIRINASEVGATIIGEGANLGMTQAARVAFALAGGRVNTDAIDNSAGVDSSDHEVNIKILCSEAIHRGALAQSDRDALLASMTSEVADKVLKHNYDQTHTLSCAETTASLDHEAYERLMCALETRGGLNRTVEGLPNTAQMQERLDTGQFLTRPEIAVLMAWSKIVLFDDLVASPLPDDPFFRTRLETYFPAPLQHYRDAIQAHRLKREIISTLLSNRTIDLAGPILMARLVEETTASPAQVVAALEVAGNLMDRDHLEDRINKLDNVIAASAQLHLKQVLAAALTNLTRTLLTRPGMAGVGDTIRRYKTSFEGLRACIPQCLSPQRQAALKQAGERYRAEGVPEALAADLAELVVFHHFPSLAEIGSEMKTPPETVFRAFEVTGTALGTDALTQIALETLPEMGTWDRRATRRLIQELSALQIQATRRALEAGGAQTWLDSMDPILIGLQQDCDTYTSRQPGFSQLSLAAEAIRSAVMSAPRQVQSLRPEKADPPDGDMSGGPY